MAWREDAHINKLRVGSAAHPVNANRLPADSPTVLTDGVWGATMTVGAETGGNAITVSIQLLDAQGNDVSGAHAVYWYWANDATGLTPTTVAHDGGTAAGTDGAIIENVANLSGWAISEIDGDIDIVATDAGAFTTYLCLVIPATGKVIVSDAVTHAA